MGSEVIRHVDWEVRSVGMVCSITKFDYSQFFVLGLYHIRPHCITTLCRKSFSNELIRQKQVNMKNSNMRKGLNKSQTSKHSLSVIKKNKDENILLNIHKEKEHREEVYLGKDTQVAVLTNKKSLQAINKLKNSTLHKLRHKLITLI